MKLFRTPSLLRSVCDRVIQIDHSPGDLSGMIINSLSNERDIAEVRSGLMPSCQCRVDSIRASSTWSTRRSSVFRSSTTSGIHQKDCPLRMWSSKETVIRTRYSLCDIWLSQIISLSISITRGAGGLSISPNLSFCATVSKDSPAFALFNDEKFYAIAKTKDYSHFKVITHRLSTLFREQKASPSDVLASGDTLLHVSRLPTR